MPFPPPIPQALSIPATCYFSGSRCHSPTCWRWEETFHCCCSRKHGWPPQPLLRYCASANIPSRDITRTAIQSGSDSGPDQYGARTVDPVLQIHSLQAHTDHLLQGRSIRRANETGIGLVIHPLNEAPSESPFLFQIA